MKDKWNAYIDEKVRLDATGDGLLNGLTFSVKDVFAVQGHTSGAGNPDWLRTHGPSEETASVLKLLLGSGARLYGMTHTDELMYSLGGQNIHYGTPVNPKAPDRLPGGSSSGSAVTVAARLADFSLGTDTGGSVRVPSAYCGIYGIRPTHGAIPMDGVVPLAPSFDTVGWMANDAETLRHVGEVLIKHPSGSSSSGFDRIILVEEAWELTEPDSRIELECLLPLLKEYASLISMRIAPEGLAEWMRIFRTLQGIEIWETHGAWIRQVNPVFGQDIAARFQWTSKLRRDESEEEFSLWRNIQARLRELLGEDGLLVLPTIPGPPPHRLIHGEENEESRSRTMQLSCIAGLSGLPQINVPAGRIAGVPIGLSFIAGNHQDLKLLGWVENWSKRHLQEGGMSYVHQI